MEFFAGIGAGWMNLASLALGLLAWMLPVAAMIRHGGPAARAASGAAFGMRQLCRLCGGAVSSIALSCASFAH